MGFQAWINLSSLSTKVLKDFSITEILSWKLHLNLSDELLIELFCFIPIFHFFAHIFYHFFTMKHSIFLLDISGSYLKGKSYKNVSNHCTNYFYRSLDCQLRSEMRKGLITLVFTLQLDVNSDGSVDTCSSNLKVLIFIRSVIFKFQWRQTRFLM